MNGAFKLVIPMIALASVPSMSAPQSQATGDTQSLQMRTDYALWMRPYQTGPLKARFGEEAGEVKLVITAIEGDTPRPVAGSVFSSSLDYQIRYGCAVSMDGRLSYFSYSSRGAKGGGYPRMADIDLKRLSELLENLPDDFSSLPPPDRRLVLQVAGADRVIARVYDRANAPESILQILRLTQSNIKSWLLSFQPKDQWTVGGGSDGGALTLSPDGFQLISAGLNGPFRFWNPETHSMLREIPTSSIETYGRNFSGAPITSLSFSPDGLSAVAEGWGEIYVLDGASLKCLRRISEPFIDRTRHQLSSPVFTPDGRYLYIQSNKPELLIVETKNWQRVSTGPEMPTGALAFFPAADGQRSVYLTRTGQIALWSPQEKRDIAILDKEGRIVRLSYSPDGSMVATVTLHSASERSAVLYRMRIWNTDDGTLIQEFRPFEQKAYSVEGLLWWPSGEYVMAVTKSDSFFTSRGVGIWSVKTGRHRGELVGCPTSVFGVALLTDGRLAEGCGDGVIRVWEASEIIKQVSMFESSMAAKVK